jgi:hypothetical protein
MNKELEQAYFWLSRDYSKQGNAEYENYVELLYNAIPTPPTEEDVCKALSAYLGEMVRYDKEENSFIACYNDEICCLFKYKDTNKLFIRFEIPLPPHLITLIGRFYENLEDNNE